MAGPEAAGAQAWVGWPAAEALPLLAGGSRGVCVVGADGEPLTTPLQPEDLVVAVRGGGAPEALTVLLARFPGFAAEPNEGG